MGALEDSMARMDALIAKCDEMAEGLKAAGFSAKPDGKTDTGDEPVTDTGTEEEPAPDAEKGVSEHTLRLLGVRESDSDGDDALDKAFGVTGRELPQNDEDVVDLMFGVKGDRGDDSDDSVLDKAFGLDLTPAQREALQSGGTLGREYAPQNEPAHRTPEERAESVRQRLEAVKEEGRALGYDPDHPWSGRNSMR